MSAKRRRLHQILAGITTCTLLSVAGCTQADTPMLTVEFGDDYNGSSVVDSLDAGRYELRIQCAGTERLTFNLRTAESVVHTSPVACRQDEKHQFTLPEPVAAEVSMDLVGAGATGKGELFAV